MPATQERSRPEPSAERRLLATLRERIGSQKFNAWFKQGSRLSLEDDHVKVLVPNSFVANWIETHYHEDICSAVKSEIGGKRPIVVTIDPSLSSSLRKRQLDVQAEIVAKATSGRARPRKPATPIRMRHRLEEFVVGPSNRLAYSAAAAVADGETAAFNPLFIHGSCGVGKTHLLQGICNGLPAGGRNGHAVRWRYVTGEQFTNEFISAIRQRTLEKFRAGYRRLDLLVIDDVHFLAAKKATQEEFLHTYNTIDAAGNRVVMASDAHPRLVGELNEQLASRFVSGMVVKIDLPEAETRMTILGRKAAGMKLSVPADVFEYVAMHIRGSIRELEGALIKLAALAELDGGPITLELAREGLADHLARTDSAITMGDIESATATYFGITPADMHSSRRTKTVSAARMTAMYLARRHTRMSFPEIGRFMGKNHSSAVLAVQRMERLLSGGGDLAWTGPTGRKSLPAAGVLELLTQQFS